MRKKPQAEMFRDKNFSLKAAWFYSSSTAVYMTLLNLTLLLSDAYLYAGSTSYFSIYFLLTVAEVFKYIYIQAVYKKDNNYYNPKQGFKLYSLVFNILKGVKVLSLIRSILIILSSTCLVYIITIFFGAQIIDKYEETLMFSSLISTLIMIPIMIHQGIYIYISVLYGTYEIQRSDTFAHIFLRNCQFTVIGAWFGAFVIPLDWGRKWQIWPIPCSFGALIGCNAAQFCSLAEVFFKCGGTLAKLKAKFK